MKWISVKERVPNNGEQVVAYGIYTYMSDEEDSSNNYQVTACWYDDLEELKWVYNYHCCTQYLYKVTHWMPLPETPAC